MRIDDAGNGGKALAQLLCNRKVVRAAAHRADVDLRGQPEVQDLRHDVGRLEVKQVLGECGGQHLTQFLDVAGGRLVALLERHQDDAVVDPDGRAVGECPIIGSRRQSDIVDDKPAVLVRNDFADLVLDRLEYPLGAFDAGGGGSANVKLDLATVDQREKVPADELHHHRAETEYKDGDNGYDETSTQQRLQEPGISVAQALEAALECGGNPRENASRGALL